jgi:DNA-binding response OmpR family regulator
MILVVDDDEAFLEQAQEILNRNRQVFLASDADRAFELARELGFSVALVDLDLPGEDGFELIRKLRDTVPELSIIVVNSALHSLTLEDARKLGAVEVLKKPITSDWKPVVKGGVKLDHWGGGKVDHSVAS